MKNVPLQDQQFVFHNPLSQLMDILIKQTALVCVGVCVNT